MSAPLTVVTELGTALGTMGIDPGETPTRPPPALRNVTDALWGELAASLAAGDHAEVFARAFANGAALRDAADGLRGRPPVLVEWRGPQRLPGDDVIPADLRLDHVYQVSCKYLSKILLNPGPARLFDRLLVGDERSAGDWFAVVAPVEYQAFFDTVREQLGLALPSRVDELTAADRAVLREALRPRALPATLTPAWERLSATVAAVSAQRWRAQLGDDRARLRLLWRLLRITQATYFVLGADATSHLRLRIGSAWDWVQAYELRAFQVAAVTAGQPTVGWYASVTARATGREIAVRGHVEVRWSHGRFQKSPEAKVYLDTPHAEVPGYFPLV